jgi:serine/threonine-protein kinase
MKGQRLKKASQTPTPTSVSTSRSAIPLELLHEASRRLGWAGLVYAGTFFLAYFGAHITFGADIGTVIPEHSLWEGDRLVQTVVASVSIAMGLAVFFLSRFGHIDPQRLLDFGLVFEVVGAFGISMSQFWGIFQTWDGVFMQEYAGIPWECIWIIIFPLLAPNTPWKTTVAAFAAASTGLLTIVLSRAAGLTHPEMPFRIFVGYFAFSTYVCALLASVVSRIIYDFGTRMGKALEVGSYQLLRPLGEGGMGEVWLAKHRMLARPAAVKLIRPEVLGGDASSRKTALRRFEREARATAALDSVHTITLYDFGISQEGSFYYVMELLRGLNFDELVRRFGPVPPERTVYFMRKVCHSLGEAHACGLVHRDIKPANIYSCRLGPEYDFVKVLDFGLVKPARTKESGGTELTVDGVATGTPAFMPPEMAMGQAEIDGRADIYGLGCVGYWLLTGQKVFEGDSPLAVVVSHVQKQPAPPSERTEVKIPDALESVILQCLEKDPANRPQTAGQLDQLLADCMPDASWTPERAVEWWSLHMTGPEIDLAECDVDVDDSQAQTLLAVKE